jgi:hypothetical protein
MTLKKKHGLRVYESCEMRGIICHKMEEGTGRERLT